MVRGRRLSEDDERFTPPPQELRSGAKGTAASLAALLLLALFHAANTAFRVGRETRPPPWDQSYHMQIAKDYQELLGEGRWREAMRLGPKPGMPPFPPLYHLSLLYAMKAADPAQAALWANVAYMALLCLALWGVAAHFGGPWAGAAAAALFTCAPEMQWLQSTQLMDLALIAWVTAGYWALLKCGGFSRWLPSLAFALLFSAAMLTKWSAFSYFFPAYYAFFQAMQAAGTRRRALSSALLAAVLTAPWYALQVPVLLPRLVDASADNAVTLASVSGLLAYPLQLIHGFETPLFILSLVALAAPTVARRKDDLWWVLSWLATSALFWFIVPNRQLRYLLPGLPGLALLAATTWPKPLLCALTAYQLIAAANFTRAVVPGFQRVIVLPVNLLRVDPPKDERWPLAEILQEAGRLHQGPAEFGNLVVVANHPHLNPTTLTWEGRRIGEKAVRIRGVNRRQCELAEFVLVKTGSLGPDGVIHGLPQARETLLAPKGWFLRAFREARRFPLPDKSEAVLYARTPLSKAPVPEGGVRYDYYEEGHFAATGLDIDLGPYDVARGVYSRARLKADRIAIRGLEIAGVAAELEDLSLVPANTPGKAARDSRPDSLLDFRLLRLKTLRLKSAAITGDSAEAFAKARVKGLADVRFRLDGEIAAEGRWRGIPVVVRARAELRPERGELEIRLTGGSIYGVPLPRVLLALHGRHVLPLRANPELPFDIEAAGLSIAGGTLKIGSGR